MHAQANTIQNLILRLLQQLLLLLLLHCMHLCRSYSQLLLVLTLNCLHNSTACICNLLQQVAAHDIQAQEHSAAPNAAACVLVCKAGCGDDVCVKLAHQAITRLHQRAHGHMAGRGSCKLHGHMATAGT
jgi:hypothetical protein